jgi:hypothetical protein
MTSTRMPGGQSSSITFTPVGNEADSPEAWGRQTSSRFPGSSSLLVIQVHGSKITTSEERVANWKILVN